MRRPLTPMQSMLGSRENTIPYTPLVSGVLSLSSEDRTHGLGCRVAYEQAEKSPLSRLFKWPLNIDKRP